MRANVNVSWRRLYAASVCAVMGLRRSLMRVDDRPLNHVALHVSCFVCSL